MADPDGAGGGNEAESAADRLEAALERIAAASARRAADATSESHHAASSEALPEVAERLDALIAHLREALDGNAA